MGARISSAAMERSENLRLAVERLYVTFERYPHPDPLVGCPCCWDRHDSERLQAKPLRKLTTADLVGYLWSAMTTVGDENDFRHFLPRILDLLPGELATEIDPELVLGKLRYGDWAVWSNQER